MGGLRRRSLVDRSGQNIPLPVGGMAPVRVQRAPSARSRQARAGAVLTMVTVLCAGTGALLLLLPGEDEASLLDGRVEIGSMVLTQVRIVPGTGAVVYGGDASYALVGRHDGTARAAAAWVTSGRLSWGTCDLRPDGLRLRETCTFTQGTVTIRSVDILDPSAASSWQRTYSDGIRVAIAVLPDGAAIPVPFPIGR